MLKSIIPTIICLMPFGLMAQISVLGGTELHITSGTTVRVTTPQQTLAIQNGAVFQNDGTIILGETAMINEADGNPIFGDGLEMITKSYNAPISNENTGGLGFEMSTSSILGTCAITRGHTPYQNDQMEWSISRWFKIIPDFNTDLEMSVVFHYDETELNGFSEQYAEIHGSSDEGISWSGAISLPNSPNDHVLAYGLDSMQLFTLYENAIDVGINDKKDKPYSIYLHPNPSNGQFVVLLDGNSISLERFSVWDASGKIIHREKLTPSVTQFSFDRQGLTNGMYTLGIWNKAELLTTTFIVQH